MQDYPSILKEYSKLTDNLIPKLKVESIKRMMQDFGLGPTTLPPEEMTKRVHSLWNHEKNGTALMLEIQTWREQKKQQVQSTAEKAGKAIVKAKAANQVAMLMEQSSKLATPTQTIMSTVSGTEMEASSKHQRDDDDEPALINKKQKRSTENDHSDSFSKAPHETQNTKVDSTKTSSSFPPTQNPPMIINLDTPEIGKKKPGRPRKNNQITIQSDGNHPPLLVTPSHTPARTSSRNKKSTINENDVSCVIPEELDPYETESLQERLKTALSKIKDLESRVHHLEAMKQKAIAEKEEAQKRAEQAENELETQKELYKAKLDTLDECIARLRLCTK